MSEEVRRATPEDNDQVLLLVRDFATSFEIDAAVFQESYAKLLANRDALALVAAHEGSLVGYSLGFCHHTFYANGKVAWLEEIMVASSHRRRGVGEALMAEFEEWARSEGAKLSALATRRASSFYQAIEYEESATYYRKLL